MHTYIRRKRQGTLLCTLCGKEVGLGEEYWSCNGSQICGECLETFARGELAPYREIRGEEARL